MVYDNQGQLTESNEIVPVIKVSQRPFQVPLDRVFYRSGREAHLTHSKPSQIASHA